MDSLVDSLVRIQTALRKASIDSALIGGLALAVWAEPRYTRDIDLKVDATRDDVRKLLAALPSECTPIGGSPAEMLERAAMLFVVDGAGNRIDLLLCDIGFDAEVIRRAMDIEILPGISARVCSAEDLIIYKMISTREKDHADVVSIIRRQGGRIVSRDTIFPALRGHHLSRMVAQ